MPHAHLDAQLLTIIAARFKVLAEPARLLILDTLRDAEMTVTELVDATALGQANLSKHLQVLHANGFVKRRKDGQFTRYAVAGRDVFRLCDIMCGRLDAEAAAHRKLVRVR
ncbi:MAG TPA: metalloregulator ArsR/SmtB family transcription factor [Gemmatimonadaceae bacterium]|nr:metalloregulator ArsR/SmtB family transcription factor [Gemmatimonadaceae bacterium]